MLMLLLHENAKPGISEILWSSITLVGLWIPGNIGPEPILQGKQLIKTFKIKKYKMAKNIFTFESIEVMQAQVLVMDI